MDCKIGTISKPFRLLSVDFPQDLNIAKEIESGERLKIKNKNK
jgi:hypothetical protein